MEVHLGRTGFAGSLERRIRTAAHRQLAEAERIDLAEHRQVGNRSAGAGDRPSEVPSCAAARIGRADLATEPCLVQSGRLLAVDALPQLF